MKALSFAISLLACGSSLSEEPIATQRYGSILADPRQPLALFTMFDDGQEPKNLKLINNAILIICWMPAEDGTFGRYQISGMDGYHSRDQVVRFLARFYEVDHPNESKCEQPNIILAGNDWGAGLELRDTLQDLSQKKALGVFYVGGWGFSKVSLVPEPELRQKLILRCYKEANP